MCPPPRLSVDLDFDYVGAVERSAMLADRPIVVQAIERIARSYGYSVRSSDEAHAGTTVTLGYRNAAATHDSLKVDIAWTNRVGVEPSRRTVLWQPEGVEPVRFALVGRSDLIAGKFRALLDRVAARDVFDAGRIANALGDNWPASVTKNAFVFLTGALPQPLTSYQIERLDRLTAREVEHNLLPMLAPGTELDRDSLVASAKRALAPLLELEPHHREFIEALDRGELRPELLFPPAVADRLARHPHLLWKAQNRRDSWK